MRLGRLAISLGFGLGLVALAGCPRGEVSVAPEIEPEAPVEAPAGVCGTAAQRFADYDWIPSDSRLTTAILRDDPELADALTEMASMVDQVQLPIRAALVFRNLAFQLAALERVLAIVELDPGELVELQSPEGDVVWVWPSDCPTATLATRALDRLAVLVRADFGNPGVRVGEGSAEQFPFDLVLVRERAVALAPLGRGARVGTWLTSSTRTDESPGAALAGLELAPIRSVLSGPSLLAGTELELSLPVGPHRRIRATASGCFDLDAAAPSTSN